MMKYKKRRMKFMKNKSMIILILCLAISLGGNIFFYNQVKQVQSENAQLELEKTQLEGTIIDIEGKIAESDKILSSLRYEHTDLQNRLTELTAEKEELQRKLDSLKDNTAALE